MMYGITRLMFSSGIPPKIPTPPLKPYFFRLVLGFKTNLLTPGADQMGYS